MFGIGYFHNCLHIFSNNTFAKCIVEVGSRVQQGCSQMYLQWSIIFILILADFELVIFALF